MTTMISRLYATPQQADMVASDLRRVYFTDYDIQVARADESMTTMADAVAAVRRTGVHRADAQAYAEALGQGATLLTVHAPWGGAAKAIEVMDRHGPLPKPVRQTEYYAGFSGGPYFLSEMIGWPLLAREPFFFSNFFGTMFRIPLLWRGYRPKVRLMKTAGLFPGTKLLSGRAMLSKRLGIPLLSGKRVFG